MKIRDTNVWKSILQTVDEIGEEEVEEDLLQFLQSVDDQLEVKGRYQKGLKYIDNTLTTPIL